MFQTLCRCFALVGEQGFLIMVGDDPRYSRLMIIIQPCINDIPICFILETPWIPLKIMVKFTNFSSTHSPKSTKPQAAWHCISPGSRWSAAPVQTRCGAPRGHWSPPTWKLLWLVVEPYPSEKYDFVSWDDDIPNIWKVIKKCSKPPTGSSWSNWSNWCQVGLQSLAMLINFAG